MNCQECGFPLLVHPFGGEPMCVTCSTAKARAKWDAMTSFTCSKCGCVYGFGQEMRNQCCIESYADIKKYQSSRTIDTAFECSFRFREPVNAPDYGRDMISWLALYLEIDAGRVRMEKPTSKPIDDRFHEVTYRFTILQDADTPTEVAAK